MQETIYTIQERKKAQTGAPELIKILLVEDSESDVYLVKSMLEDSYCDFKFEISDSSRLIDAFNLLKQNSFDLVLLDLNLLDIQGTASVAALHSEIPETPIIVYSGVDDPKLRREAMLCGAKGYQVKSEQTPGNLASIIENVLCCSN